MWRIALLALPGFIAAAPIFSARAEQPAETTPVPRAASPAAAAPAAGEALPLRAAVPKIALKQAIQEALKREVRIAVAEGALRRAEALVTRARSGWLPSVIGHASYLRLEKDRKLGETVLAARDQVMADLTVNVPLVAVKPWFET